MNNSQQHILFWCIVFFSVVVFSFIFWHINQQSNHATVNSGKEDSEQIIWGVDSADYTTEDFYECVIEQYGKPKAWGRYIGTKEGVSRGLDKSEIAFLHERDISIIPIYNLFTDATGYKNGQSEAEQAIEIATAFEVKKGVSLFANIEPEYPVDSAFIQGWTDGVHSSQYKPGIYGLFKEGNAISEAFQEAASSNKKVADDVMIWSSYPQKKVTIKENAPSFNRETPDSVNVSIWQYGIEGEVCNIDTNVLKSEALERLW